MTFNLLMRSLWSRYDLMFYITSTVRLFEFLSEATYDPSKYSVWLCFYLQFSHFHTFFWLSFSAWQILKGFEILSKDSIYSAVSFVAQANIVCIIQHNTDKCCTTNARKIHLKNIATKTRMKIRN